MEKNNWLFSNRYFTPQEVSLIKNIVFQYWSSARKKIATVICEKLNWRGFNGQLKVIPCLEALRKMEKQGLVVLPPKRPCSGYHPLKPRSNKQINFKKPKGKITGSIEMMGKVRFELVVEKEKNELWRYLI